MTATGPVIVGNAMAGLVTAWELAQRGRDITLVNPGGPWGAYFAGVRVGDQAFDAGMVTFEFTSYAAQAPRAALATYDPSVRNDIGRFSSVVGDWLSMRTQVRTIETPQMRVAGRFYPDLFLSNALTALPQLPFAAEALADLAGRADPGDLHARRKATGAAFDDADFETASRANHGDVLHERLMAPFLQKVLGDEGRKLLARYHRIPWLPLYWPETLRQSLNGAPPSIAPTPYSYPLRSSVAEVVGGLVRDLEASPHVRLVAAPSVEIRPCGAGGIVLANGERIETQRLAWSSTLPALRAALGRPNEAAQGTRAALSLAFLNVDLSDVTHAFSVIHVADAETALYRITDLSTCAASPERRRRWVVELNPEVFRARRGDADVGHAIALELAQLGVVSGAEAVDVLRVMPAPGGLPVPDLAAQEAWAADRACVERLAPQITLLAAASGFIVTSLGDQVAQGLKLADEVLAA